jgi:hypothetical protein
MLASSECLGCPFAMKAVGQAYVHRVDLGVVKQLRARDTRQYTSVWHLSWRPNNQQLSI